MALFADGRHGFLADCLAAQRSRAVGRIDEACVGQRQQLLPQRVVELPAKVCSRPPECDTKVRTADVADEQRIAGQHGVGGGGAAIEIEDENRDRFGGMARRLECLEAHASQLHTIAVSERRERELRLRRSAKIDRRADAIAQLQVTGDEVRVKVREKDVLYLETVRVGERQILTRRRAADRRPPQCASVRRQSDRTRARGNSDRTDGGSWRATGETALESAHYGQVYTG